jgi:hypothetical protein
LPARHFGLTDQIADRMSLAAQPSAKGLDVLGDAVSLIETVVED